MQIKVERTDSANATAEAKVSKSFLDQKQQSMVANISKGMKIDGFRKGKVPAHVIKARHGEQIEKDVEQDAIREFLDDALKELGVEKSSIVGEPSITKMDRVDDGLEVEVKISFRPEVVLGDYKALVPEYKTPLVLKKDIDERVESMMKFYSPLKEIEEARAVKDGDFVKIDFEGFVDGVAFEGGKAEDYSLEIGSGSFIPGFEEGVKEMSIGDEKDIAVTFPKEYNSKELAGKESIFKIKLNSIEVKTLPEEPDAEMFEKLLPGEEDPTVEKLEAKVKDQIKNEKLAELFSEEVKPAFIDAVIEKIEFALPENIVEQEIDMQVRNSFQNLSEDEIKEYSENPEKITEKREEHRDEAAKSVKLTFIVDELARAEKIKVEDQEVMQMIYFEAMQQGQNPKEYYEQYEKQGVLPAIKMSIIEEKLFSQLFRDEK